MTMVDERDVDIRRPGNYVVFHEPFGLCQFVAQDMSCRVCVGDRSASAGQQARKIVPCRLGHDSFLGMCRVRGGASDRSVSSAPVERPADGDERVGDMLLDLVRGDAEARRDRGKIFVA